MANHIQNLSLHIIISVATSAKESDTIAEDDGVPDNCDEDVAENSDYETALRRQMKNGNTFFESSERKQRGCIK